jgi:hypothetical protein
MATQRNQLAMFTNPHDFTQLQFRNCKELQSEVVELYNKGLSLREFETRCGIARSVVRRIVSNAKIPIQSFEKEDTAHANFLFAKRGAKPPYGFW